MSKKPFGFVLMPFDEAFADVYRLGIKAALNDADIICERVDEQIFHNESILQRIYNQIELADFIIADMKCKNANVFYEVGYAHASKKICVLLTSNADDIPFDMKHHRHIIYNNSISELKKQLAIEIEHIKKIIGERSDPIAISVNTAEGSLEKTDWSATAVVDLRFDLNNNSSQTSPDIETIYIYTNKEWKFSQDKQVCLSGVSDDKFYKLRHIIKPPVARLQSGMWAQFQVNCRRIVATTFKGEKLTDKYNLKGTILVRVICSGVEYKFPIQLDVDCEEFPF
jgi:nucleoside 2-deoxyribosyltransferase